VQCGQEAAGGGVKTAHDCFQLQTMGGRTHG
jgi:hypothetical protein